MTPLPLAAKPTPEVQALAVPAPWKAYLLPVGTFPLEESQLLTYRNAVQQFADSLMQQHALHGGLMLQSWKMSGKHGGDLVQKHAADWPFDLGFGVWPDRPAPEGWTDESLQNAAAAVYRGEEPQLPMHRVLLFTIAATETFLDAAGQLAGFGAAVQLFTTGPLTEVRRRGREELLPRIQDRRFRGGQVYLPLLDAQTLTRARDLEELDAWLCGIDVYLRESAEDRGLLVISRLPLEPLLEQFMTALSRA